MKAVLLIGYGGVDQLEVREVPEPRVGPNELKVRVAGASINPIDWKLRRGDLKAMMPLTFPAPLGSDASGEVIEVGEGVRGFAVGDRVMGYVRAGYAEYVVAGVDSWAKLAKGLDERDAAALALVGLTGVQLAEEAVDARRGQTVLITGALGGVGRAAVYAAKARGAIVIAGVRGSQRGEATSLGAARVVALDAGELADLPDLDAIGDTIGGDAVRALLAKVKPGGVVGSVLGEPPGAKERALLVRAIHAHTDATRLGQIGAAVVRGELLIPISKRFPLAQVREAQQFAEKGAAGKVILTP